MRLIGFRMRNDRVLRRDATLFDNKMRGYAEVFDLQIDFPYPA